MQNLTGKTLQFASDHKKAIAGVAVAGVSSPGDNEHPGDLRVRGLPAGRSPVGHWRHSRRVNPRGRDEGLVGTRAGSWTAPASAPGN